MKRGKCLVNCIELDIPLAVLTDIIPLPENQNMNKLYWKGQCTETERLCELITQLSENNILSIYIKNTNIAINGNKLKCSISSVESTSEAEKDQSGLVLEGNVDQHCIITDSTSVDNTTKRKRGRPRKTDEEKLLNKVQLNSEKDISEDVSTGENEIKRYGLRGVKISEAVMRAEMGPAYKDKTSLDNNVDINKTSNSEDGLDAVNDEIIDKMEDNENVYDDHQDVDYIDSDYVGYISDEQDFEPNYTKRKFGLVINGRGQKRKNKIDIGDVKIPKYREKIDFKKDKECKYCQKCFFHFVGVEDHVRRYHMKEADVETYLEELKSLRMETCKICNKTFNNIYHLIEHEKRSHLENTSVKCFRCGKLYKNVQSLKNHIRAVHSIIGQPYSCNQCTAKFKWSTTLKQHIEEIHEGKMKAACKHCGKKFPRQNLLNRHMRIHGTDQSKRLFCKFCGKGFWYEHNLQRHIKVIHGPHEEHFHCSYCGKGFNMKSAMVTHVQQVHFNIFPFHCNECSVGFKRSKLYRLHMVTMHNILDVNTLNTNGRQRYKYGKTEEDLFYCSHCSLSFCYKTKMVEHMHSAHGEDFPYMCTHCNQGFLEKSFLSHHLLKAHDEIMPADETKEEEKNRFQMVTIDINGEKKDLEVESFNLPQPVFIEKTEEVENIVNVEIKENQDVSGECTSQSLFFEVSKGEDTIHYVIEQSANGDPTILPQELANLLLAAEQSLQGVDENVTSEIQFIPQDQEIIDPENETQLSEVNLGDNECDTETD